MVVVVWVMCCGVLMVLLTLGVVGVVALRVAFVPVARVASRCVLLLKMRSLCVFLDMCSHAGERSLGL